MMCPTVLPDGETRHHHGVVQYSGADVPVFFYHGCLLRMKIRRGHDSEAVVSHTDREELEGDQDEPSIHRSLSLLSVHRQANEESRGLYGHPRTQSTFSPSCLH